GRGGARAGPACGGGPAAHTVSTPHTRLVPSPEIVVHALSTGYPQAVGKIGRSEDGRRGRTHTHRVVHRCGPWARCRECPIPEHEQTFTAVHNPVENVRPPVHPPVETAGKDLERISGTAA